MHYFSFLFWLVAYDCQLTSAFHPDRHAAHIYSWDRANRLLSVNNTAYQYQYDGLGSRVLQTVIGIATRYLLDAQPGLVVVLAATTDPNTTRYVHGPLGIHAREDPTGSWTWMGQDGLGSARMELSDVLAVNAMQHYAPYGVPFGTLGSFGPYQFTGEPMDGNGLLYLRNRYYSPALGVFPSLDPAEGVLQRPMSLNGYSWVEGNVPNLTDPTGRQACECQCEGLLGIELVACIMSCFSQGYLYFPYTRQNAADKARAMAEGRDNDLARFAESGTSSTRFISLALHAGGLPMTVEPGQTDCNTQVLDRPVQAWCAKAVDSNLEGSRTWLLHNSQTDDETTPIANLAADKRLIGYLLGNPEVLGPDICYSGGGYHDMVSVEEVFGTPEELRTDAKSTITVFSNNQMLPTDSPPIYDVYGNAGLATRIKQVMSKLSGFETGDYIFTGGKEEHGFMIVDKGPAVRCDDLTTILADVPVFWVADLPGNQRGTSRPFYCSRLVDPQTGSWFTARFWYFIKVPNGVWVRGNRLYRDDPLRR